MNSKKRTRDDYSMTMPAAAAGAPAWSVPPSSDWNKWEHLAAPAAAQYHLQAQAVGRQSARAPTGRNNTYTPSPDDLAVIRNFKRFKRKGSSSKYKGVFYVKKEKKWRAQICLKGKKQYVGTFTNDRDAAIARDKRIRKLFGEVKELLNFAPPSPVVTAAPLPTQHAYQAHAAYSHQFQLPTNPAPGRSGERIPTHSDQSGVTMDNLHHFIKPGHMAKLHGAGGDPTMIQHPTAYNYVSSAYGLPPGNSTSNPRPSKRNRQPSRSNTSGSTEFTLDPGYQYSGNYTIAS